MCLLLGGHFIMNSYNNNEFYQNIHYQKRFVISIKVYLDVI